MSENDKNKAKSLLQDELNRLGEGSAQNHSADFEEDEAELAYKNWDQNKAWDKIASRIQDDSLELSSSEETPTAKNANETSDSNDPEQTEIPKIAGFPLMWLSIPRVVFASLVVAIAVVSFTFWLESKEQPLMLASKGSQSIKMLVNQKEANPLGTVMVSPGDTLSFKYRSITHQYIQVWYSDDGLSPQPYFGHDNQGVLLKASNDWAEIENQVVLGDGWKTENLLVFLSDKPFPEDFSSVLSNWEQSKNALENARLFKFKILNKAESAL